jgi:hypothetical protein
MANEVFQRDLSGMGSKSLPVAGCMGSLMVVWSGDGTPAAPGSKAQDDMRKRRLSSARIPANPARPGADPWG